MKHSDRLKLFLALVCVTLILLYLPLLAQDFFTIDDFELVQIPQLQAKLGWLSLQNIFSVGTHIDFYPLRDLSYLFDIHFLGNTPLAMRTHGLLIFIVSVAGLVLLLVELGLTPALALAGASVWALHPMHIESIFWISARKDLLSLCFGIYAGWAYLRAKTNNSSLGYALSLGLFVASLLSKAAIGLLPLLILFDDLPARRKKILVIAGGSCGLAWSLLQSWFYSQVNDMRFAYAWSYRLQASLAALGKAVAGLILPQTNVIDIENWGSWIELNKNYSLLGGLFLFTLMGLFVYAVIRRQRSLALGLLGFALLYAPVCALLFAHRQFYSVRYFAAPLLMLWISALTYFKHSFHIKALVVLAAVLAFLCFQDMPHWESNLEVRRKALRLTPASVALQTQLWMEIKNELRAHGPEGAEPLVNEEKDLRHSIEKICDPHRAPQLSCWQWIKIHEQGWEAYLKIFADNGWQHFAVSADILWHFKHGQLPDSQQYKLWAEQNRYTPRPSDRLIEWTLRCFRAGPGPASAYLKQQKTLARLSTENIDLFMADFSERKDFRTQLQRCL